MSKIVDLAAFAHRWGYDNIPEPDLRTFKAHVLDTLGSAIGALAGGPVVAARQRHRRPRRPRAMRVIGGGRTSLPQAAFHNGALVRYLDYMDTYLAENGECHPCDNFASLLAAAEHAGRDGRDLLGALAVSYQILCRLSHDTKIMKQGFDHTTTLTFSIAVGVSKLLGLGHEQTANALAVAGADAAGPMANRTEPISQWKGLASAGAAYRTTFAVLLAREGVTGPRLLFEGPGGMEQMTRDPWDVDWATEPLDVIGGVMIKKYNAEARSQSALDATLKLAAENKVRPESVASVRVDTFRPAYDNLGGGKYGEKDVVRAKEQADHNLGYMVAAALLNGEVGPAQYAPDRMTAPDVQGLMRKVEVEPKLTFTWRDPQEQPTRVTIMLEDGRKLVCEQSDFEGFPTRPMSWERVVEKFDRLAGPYADAGLRRELVAAVGNLDAIRVQELTVLLERVTPPGSRVYSGFRCTMLFSLSASSPLPVLRPPPDEGRVRVFSCCFGGQRAKCALTPASPSAMPSPGVPGEGVGLLQGPRAARSRGYSERRSHKAVSSRLSDAETRRFRGLWDSL